jgi:AcrR family transcriptional regulator
MVSDVRTALDICAIFMRTTMCLPLARIKFGAMDGMPTRTMPRQARSARSLDLILDAAERMFHERGVAETSTVDVATAAGVSVGRLYYWFPDKDAVVAAVVARAEDRLRTLLSSVAFDDPAMGVDQVVSHLVPVLGGFFRQHPGSLAVLVHHGIDGHPASSLRGLFVDSICAMLAVRNPAGTRADAEIIAASIVRVAASFFAEATRSADDEAASLLSELEQLVTAYVVTRWPMTSAPASSARLDA